MRAKAIFLTLMLFMGGLALASQPQPGGQNKDLEIPPTSLSALAAKADIVAVAQVMDTDYVYTHSYPNEGSAFLKILFSYKLNQKVPDIIEVYEKGLHPHECYFENPTVLEEGRRYLVFFLKDPDDTAVYRGFPQGCALEILVATDSRYVLKAPVDGIELTGNLNAMSEPFSFQDSHAVIKEDTLSPKKRDDLLSKGLIVPYQSNFKYTHAIPLTRIRKLISPGALKPERK